MPTELRLQVPDEVVDEFQQLLGPNATVTGITRDALTLFQWALRERARGRVVLSSDAQGNDKERITIDSLERVHKVPPGSDVA